MLAIALTPALAACAPPTPAKTFTVNSAADAPDASPGARGLQHGRIAPHPFFTRRRITRGLAGRLCSYLDSIPCQKHERKDEHLSNDEAGQFGRAG